MSLALSVLADDPDNVDSLTYTTPAFTPAAGSGIIVCSHYTSNSTLAPPTLDIPDWLSGVWTQEADAASGTQGLTIFSGVATGAPSSDDLTATFDVQQACCHLGVIQITEQAAGDYIPQSNIDNGPAATSATVTLPGALAAATSVVLGAIGVTNNSPIDPADGESELLDNGHGSPTRRMQIQFKLNDTSSSWTFTSGVHRSAAIEIVQSTAVADTQTRRYQIRRSRMTSW